MPQTQTKRRRSGWTLLLALLAFVVAGLVGAGLAGAYWLQANARERAISLLENRFAKVELRSLDFEIRPRWDPLPRFAATGEGLSLALKDREEAPPFLNIRKFTVELTLGGLWAVPPQISRLDLDQMIIQIPPRRSEASDPSSDRQDTPVFVIGELHADGATLMIHSKNPEKDPLRFDLHELRLTAVGPREPMNFEALLDNPKPPGLIKTRGAFGPLSVPDVGRSPVSGSYIFEKADLAVFGGIGGTLYSEGEYGGVLERIEVKGSTEVPDFYLKPVQTPVSLATDFNAIVDGTSGDTFLEPVRVQIENSQFEARGGVAKKSGEPGKTIELDAAGSKGRIEDFLRLAVKSREPLLTGELSFESRIVIPPGKIDILDKLALAGHFNIGSTKFPSAEVQEKVNVLSELGTGQRGKREGPTPDAVVSDVSGEFRLRRGIMEIEKLNFSVPGAKITLLGQYNLLTEEVDFRGELRSDAKVSQMTSGIKSLLLKPIDPLFKRDGVGAVIPIRIGGTRSNVSFGVEKGRIFTRKNASN
jgi:hypothetical protein